MSIVARTILVSFVRWTPPPLPLRRRVSVLNCHACFTAQKAMSMWDANAKDKGGSIYIQSKVLNAKDCLELHQQEKEAGEPCLKNNPSSPPLTRAADVDVPDYS